MINDLNIKLCNNNNGQVSLTSVGIYLDRTKPSCLRDVKVLLQITLGRKPNFRWAISLKMSTKSMFVKSYVSILRASIYTWMSVPLFNIVLNTSMESEIVPRREMFHTGSEILMVFLSGSILS